MLHAEINHEPYLRTLKRIINKKYITELKITNKILINKTIGTLYVAITYYL